MKGKVKIVKYFNLSGVDDHFGIGIIRGEREVRRLVGAQRPDGVHYLSDNVSHTFSTMFFVSHPHNVCDGSSI